MFSCLPKGSIRDPLQYIPIYGLLSDVMVLDSKQPRMEAIYNYNNYMEPAENNEFVKRLKYIFSFIYRM